MDTLLLILIIIFIIILLVQLNNKDHFYKKNGVNNPCIDFLSNKDYLVHMIPHHQVAIDMCELMIPISKSKTILNIYRNNLIKIWLIITIPMQRRRTKVTASGLAPASASQSSTGNTSRATS